MVQEFRGGNYKYAAGVGFPNINISLYLGYYVWEDLDADGIQDAGEPGIANVTVNLYYGNRTYIGNTTTNATGYYIFTGLLAANYTLQFVAPAKYAFSQQDVGADDTIDSDANETGWTTIITSLYYNNSDMDCDAGLYRYASIGDFVWNDCNVSGYYNGIQQPGEPGVPDVNVSLYNRSGLVNTTRTIKTGYYIFTNVTPGAYYLVFELPGGYTWTLQDLGGDNTIDSDVDRTGRTDNVTLLSGQIDLTWDAGLASEPCLPVPEVDTVVLFSAGLLTLAGYLVVRRREEISR